MSLQNFRFVQRFSVWAAIVVIVAQPQWLAAAEQAGVSESVANVTQGMSVIDVELQPGGLLVGQLTDKQGRALSAADIHVTNERDQWLTKTDSQGRFQVAGLSGNTYRVNVGQQVQLVRAWATGTAPPRTVHGLLLVQDHGVVLGQHCASPVCGSAVAASRHPLANPWIFGGIVAAAIAIPVAIHNADDDDSASN